MDIKKIVNDLAGCDCGRVHSADIKTVEIGSGILNETARILKEYKFPKNILCVADKNTLNASDGILDVLNGGGYNVSLKLYDDLRVASDSEVNCVTNLTKQYGADGILSIGSGSLNDVCRRAALLADKEFAIFATAPSMDGFASGTSPITSVKDNFKTTLPARQPSIIIADTKILAAAPPELKSAGFGDMIAKYIGLADWKISNITTGEYYCEKIAALTRQAVDKMIKLAPRVTENDEETAGAIMESLVFTGIAMKLADCVRPASGTEHIISHYWEIKKLEKGLISDFHGKKVSVASLIAAKIYYQIIKCDFYPCMEKLDWDDIYKVYGKNFETEVKNLNNPTITESTSPEIIAANEDKIKEAVKAEIPEPGKLLAYMKTAGAAISLSDISVSHDLGREGVIYHPYMRRRMTLMRLIPMLGLPVSAETLANDAII